MTRNVPLGNQEKPGLAAPNRTAKVDLARAGQRTGCTAHHRANDDARGSAQKTNASPNASTGRGAVALSCAASGQCHRGEYHNCKRFHFFRLLVGCLLQNKRNLKTMVPELGLNSTVAFPNP